MTWLDDVFQILLKNIVQGEMLRVSFAVVATAADGGVGGRGAR